MDPWLVAIFRILHIGGAMVWLGGAVVLVRAVAPAADALGDDAMAFMRELNLKGPLPNIIMLSALSTLVFGWLLYYNNFGSRMVFSTISTSALSIGALLGTAAFFEAFFLIKRSNDRMRALAAEIAAAGGPPSPEQAAEMGKLMEKAQKASIRVTWVITVAMIGMALFDAGL